MFKLLNYYKKSIDFIFNNNKIVIDKDKDGDSDIIID